MMLKKKSVQGRYAVYKSLLVFNQKLHRLYQCLIPHFLCTICKSSTRQNSCIQISHNLLFLSNANTCLQVFCSKLLLLKTLHYIVDSRRARLLATFRISCALFDSTLYLYLWGTKYNSYIECKI